MGGDDIMTTEELFFEADITFRRVGDTKHEMAVLKLKNGLSEQEKLRRLRFLLEDRANMLRQLVGVIDDIEIRGVIS
jgi:hypothetical protein